MKIILLRHGRPNVPKQGKLKANEFYRWVEAYNAAALDEMHKPSNAALAIASQCKTVVCSDLHRSTESAYMLGVQEVHYKESVFNEAEIPLPEHSSLKLPVNIWLLLLRVGWFFGYVSNCESLSAARKRAAQGAELLQDIAANTGSVLLVGHGFINRLISKELLSNGWQGAVNPGKKYWAFEIYTYPN